MTVQTGDDLDAIKDDPSPSPSDDNGRDPASGRFLLGNRLASGNPHHRRVAELRAALLDAVSAEDLRAIVGKLIERAKAGDIVAAREVLDRIFGRPNQPIEGAVFVPEQLTEDQRRRAARIAERFDAID